MSNTEALRAAAQQALEALTNCANEHGHRCNRCDSEVDDNGNIADALRAALAQQPAASVEPVAWFCEWFNADGSPEWDQYHDRTDPMPADDEWEDRPPDRVTPLYATPHPAPARVPPGWQPIETAPKDGRKVMLTYLNRSGKRRTVLACWLTQEAAEDTDHEGVGLNAGWYECIDNWPDYTEVAIHEGEPTHWMPLPAAPEAQPA